MERFQTSIRSISVPERPIRISDRISFRSSAANRRGIAWASFVSLAIIYPTTHREQALFSVSFTIEKKICKAKLLSHDSLLSQTRFEARMPHFRSWSSKCRAFIWLGGYQNMTSFRPTFFTCNCFIFEPIQRRRGWIDVLRLCVHKIRLPCLFQFLISLLSKDRVASYKSEYWKGRVPFMHNTFPMNAPCILAFWHITEQVC
jgi:hypothetical protein